MKKVIVRIKGGLGNQLFCYAAARRLALANGAELVIDNVSGFVRDRAYRRRYGLDRFAISARKATPTERMEPFERYRRGLAKVVARHRPFQRRRYVEQERDDFDPRLLAFEVKGTVTLDGLWQSEAYFTDVEQAIRNDLQIVPPEDAINRQMAERIRGCDAVAVHVRWFARPGSESIGRNASVSYYRRALDEINRSLVKPHYFLFSDDPDTARALLSLPEDCSTCVDHNRGDNMAYADLWLLSQCKHFIIANSTFSWWGAWLAERPGKTVIAPGDDQAGATVWGAVGVVPKRWVQIG